MTIILTSGTPCSFKSFDQDLSNIALKKFLDQFKPLYLKDYSQLSYPFNDKKINRLPKEFVKFGFLTAFLQIASHSIQQADHDLVRQSIKELKGVNHD